MPKWSRKQILMAIFFLLIMLISVLLLFWILLDETILFRIVKNGFILPLLDIGFWAVFVFLFLMILQSLIAPIPSELVLLSGAMIFGFLWGTVIGVIGSMLSAWVTFYVAKNGGRTILEAAGEKTGFVERFIMAMDDWIERWGLWAIIVGRSVPVIMFDPVSIAAGISNTNWKQYTIATFIGSIPRALFYSWMGILTLDGRGPSSIKNMSAGEIEAASARFNSIFLIIFAVLVSMLVVANFVVHRREQKLAVEQS